MAEFYNCDYDHVEIFNSKITNPKNTRIIFVIDRKLTKEELEDIILHCKIEFFSIDTLNFENVKEYFEMITNINEICRSRKIDIGIIAELSGRKIKVDKINQKLKQDSDENGNIILKEGQTVLIKQSNPYKIKQNCDCNDLSLSVTFNEINKLVKPNDSIIINDNKGLLKVLSIVKQLKKPNSVLDLKNLEKENEIKVRKNSIDNNDYKICCEVASLHEEPLLIAENNDEINITENDELDDYENFHSIGDDNNEELINQSINNFFRKTSRKFSITYQNSKCFKIIKKSFVNDLNKVLKNISKRTKFGIQKLENKNNLVLYCEVKYDCLINKNSVLFIPNVNYSEIGIDVLSKREVAEINYLDQNGVNFICISITSMKDIESIREVNSNIKIIASFPDFTSLENIDEILNNCSGVVLSRTFQIVNKNTISQTSEISKKVIFKCKKFGIPIFSYIDINENSSGQNNLSQSLDTICSINDGIDGFFVNINTKSKNYNKLINNFTSHVKEYNLNNFSSSIFLNNKGCNISKKHRNNKYNYLLNMILHFDLLISKYILIYAGDDLEDVIHITSLKLKSPLLILSTNRDFLMKSLLYYSVIILDEDFIKNYQESFPKSCIEYFYF